ncbi:MAG: OmpW family protein [Aquabacterium sp.]|uniref:OmpW/AlkL family protein n=1 Tax=Aquabacterium sp. TaxID=1872578 RepID=UPI0025C1400F|nr:OmpW family outer membrane protein [Aquabacterium sp.]MBI5924517.1 OmpW family protein [Aquabacterium sp.]
MIATSIRTRLIAAAALACAAAAPAFAGDFMVRARVLSLEPANQSTEISALSVPADAITVNSKYIWEIDASYFVTENVALELIATTPQKQTISLAGTKIGTLRHLPPTLTAQWHFAPANPVVRPYVGFGVNYTHFSAVNLDAGPVLGSSTPLDIKRHSWGTAIQIGADFPITKQLSFNVDFKKIDIRTDVKVKATGEYLSTVKVDPILFGVGIGYRF